MTSNVNRARNFPKHNAPIPPFSSPRRRFDQVHVAETQNRGLGVFADATIKSGFAVGQVHGEIKPADFRSHYCVDFAGAVLEPVAPYRFLNHSCDPNCEFVEWEIEDQLEIALDETTQPNSVFELWLHTLRDVQKGEELTIDYGWSWQFAIPCKCGARHCRGWICKLDELDVCLRNRGLPDSFPDEFHCLE